MRIFSLTAILCLTCFAGYAQEGEVKPDTISTANDSIRLKNGKMVSVAAYVKRFDPRKALFFAAILPGSGQAYNKKYWKMPLVYGGFWGLLAVVKFYNDAEVKYKNQLFYLINNPSVPYYPTSGLTTDQLRRVVDLARRQRDYFTAITAFFYILQMVDAHVDAHLKEFDVNPRLHVRVTPIFSPATGVGVGLTLRF